MDAQQRQTIERQQAAQAERIRVQQEAQRLANERNARNNR